MEAPDGGAGGAEGHEGDQDGPKILGDQGGTGNQDGAGSAGVPDDEALPAPVRVPVLLIPHGPWPGWQAELVVSRPAMHLHEFSLKVPFLTTTGAELARRSLAPDQEYPDVQSELTVNGSCLNVRWIAQDPGRLHTLFTTFLNDLFLMFQIMEHLGPQFSPIS